MLQYRRHGVPGCGENVPALAIHQACMDMQAIAGVVRVWLCHEGCVEPVAARDIAHGMAEQVTLVGRQQGIGNVIEVDFELAGAEFGDRGVGRYVLQFACVADVGKQLFERTGNVDIVNLRSCKAAMTVRQKWWQGRLARRACGVKQVKLKLGRHNRCQAAG